MGALAAVEVVVAETVRRVVQLLKLVMQDGQATDLLVDHQLAPTATIAAVQAVVEQEKAVMAMQTVARAVMLRRHYCF